MVTLIRSHGHTSQRDVNENHIFMTRFSPVEFKICLLHGHDKERNTLGNFSRIAHIYPMEIIDTIPASSSTENVMFAFSQNRIVNRKFYLW